MQDVSAQSRKVHMPIVNMEMRTPLNIRVWAIACVIHFLVCLPAVGFSPITVVDPSGAGFMEQRGISVNFNEADPEREAGSIALFSVRYECSKLRKVGQAQLALRIVGFDQCCYKKANVYNTVGCGKGQ
jgi:hypothetical protein